jgi:hypothetical protein
MGASSTASERTAEITAPDAAAPRVQPGPPLNAAVPLVSVIEPCSDSCGTASRTASSACTRRSAKNDWPASTV